MHHAHVMPCERHGVRHGVRHGMRHESAICGMAHPIRGLALLCRLQSSPKSDRRECALRHHHLGCSCLSYRVQPRCTCQGLEARGTQCGRMCCWHLGTALWPMREQWLVRMIKSRRKRSGERGSGARSVRAMRSRRHRSPIHRPCSSATVSRVRLVLFG